MSDTPDPQYDPSRVMLNGAAIGLVTSLVSGMESRLRSDALAMEKRLTDKLASQDVDIDGLEEWRASIVESRLRREGQWSVFLALGRFLNRYGRALQGIGLALLAGVLALLGGINIRFGA